MDEKQKGNASAQVECPQCGMAYIIQLPYSNILVATLDTAEKLIQKTCPVSTWREHRSLGSTLWVERINLKRMR